MGNLGKVWVDIPDDIDSMEELQSYFNRFFGVSWNDVLVGAEKSFGHHASYDAYFAVKNLKAVTDMTVEQLLEQKSAIRPLNIVAG